MCRALLSESCNILYNVTSYIICKRRNHSLVGLDEHPSPRNLMPDKPLTPDEKLQQEFNRWAAAGEGPKMEQHHLNITEKSIRLMNLRLGERVLDLGCGSGWATRLLARLVGDG